MGSNQRTRVPSTNGLQQTWSSLPSVGRSHAPEPGDVSPIPADQPSQATVRDGLLGNLTDAAPGTPAGDHPVMEFPQTMPDDDLTVADGDAWTCSPAS